MDSPATLRGLLAALEAVHGDAAQVLATVVDGVGGHGAALRPTRIVALGAGL